MMKKQLGRIRITIELFEQILQLPEGANIKAYSWEPYDGSGNIHLVIESPDLESVAEGMPIPYYNPLLTRHEDDSITWEWGEPK